MGARNAKTRLERKKNDSSPELQPGRSRGAVYLSVLWLINPRGCVKKVNNNVKNMNIGCTMSEHELNRYWKTVVETLQDGIMIVDTAGTIVFVNTAFERITGYSLDEIMGKPCTILNCSVCDVSRQCDDCNWCVLFREGRMNNKQCMIIRKDGTSLPIIKNASTLVGEENRVMGAVETLTDISAIVKKDAQIEGFRRELESMESFQGIIGTSSAMQQVFDLIANAALSDAPVIIYGESGTGKEMVARAIHESSERDKKPYVKVNCSALNESILESELFGHVKGAFTGAYQNREGKFEAAGQGDIFLDEIGDLSLSTQVKLLRVLEEKVVERVGENRSIDIRARIITATNRDLRTLVSQGRFREDFYYRINVIPIWIPPLRERVGDIPLLAEAFFRRIRLKSGKDFIHGISSRAFELLTHYPWPGNVRELKSAFEFAFVTCRDSMIKPEHLPKTITTHENLHTSPPAPEPSMAGDLDAIKRSRLVEALKQAQGNRTRAAKILGISRTSVWNQIKRYKIEFT